MKQLRNIESAFKHLKIYLIIWLVAVTIIGVYSLWSSNNKVEKAMSRIYIIAGGKAIEAFASNRKDNIPIEAKDHVQTFHELFFNLSPDEVAIDRNLNRALYLADRSAKDQYDNLKESNYYEGMVRGNVSQEVTCDSISLNTSVYPYYFRYYGTQRLVRSSVIITRSLITEGYLRTIARTENNSHGFLIERWMTIENKDLTIKKRN